MSEAVPCAVAMAATIHLPDVDPEDVTDLSEIDAVREEKAHRNPMKRLKKRRLPTTREHPSSPVKESTVLKTVTGDVDIAASLASLGYSIPDASNWHSMQQPKISLAVTAHSEEDGHTFYTIHGSTHGGIGEQACNWVVQKRLTDIRNHIHTLVKSELGDQYDLRFRDTHFALRLAPPGTTARLQAWFQTLSACLTERLLRPAVLALVLCSLGAPPKAIAASGAVPVL